MIFQNRFLLKTFFSLAFNFQIYLSDFPQRKLIPPLYPLFKSLDFGLGNFQFSNE